MNIVSWLGQSFLFMQGDILKLFFIFSFSVQFLTAQVEWPPITQTSKPWTRWWWQGSAVDESGLKTTMKMYQQAGLGGLEITPIYGVQGQEASFINYMSPNWMDRFSFVLSEAKKINLGIDMATGTGWPFGGPWVTETDACKYFTFKTYSLTGGQSLVDSIKYRQEHFVRTANGKRLTVADLKKPINYNKDLQGLAIDQVRFDVDLELLTLMAYDEQGTALDLTNNVSNGKLNWQAPSGKWTLYAVFNGLHGKMVERAAPGGEGNVIDHFDEKALKNYLSFFDKAFEGKDLSVLRGFFNDSYEVDDARGQSNWTPDYFKEFTKRRGYDLRNELPALLSKELTEKNVQVLYDYRETISELVLEKFTEPWVRWGHNKNKLIRNQSHGSPANILDLYAAVDIPETEGTDLTRFKFATSVAHVMGKPLASAEAATWLDEHFLSSLADIKSSIDHYFLGGVNHIVYHGTNYSPPQATWPGWLFYAAVHLTPANPMWKDFKTLNDYVARCQSFLQQGQPDHQVLLYFPFADRNHQPGRDLLHHFDGMQGFENTIFKSSADSMIDWGYQWDLISDKQIQSLKCIDGQLIAPGGPYQTIVLSGVQYLPLSTWRKLDSLTKQGAQIIFHNNIPSKVPGYRDLISRQEEMNTILETLQLPFPTITPEFKSIGSGKIYTGLDLKSLLNRAAIKSETALYQLGLQCIKRNKKSGSYYFIHNPTANLIEAWVPLNTVSAEAVLYDPMRMVAGRGKWKKTDKGIEVWLSLLPAESIICETGAKLTKHTLFPYVMSDSTKRIELNSGWRLKFLSGGPSIPAPITLLRLQDWLALDIPDIKAFSGSASYTIEFTGSTLNGKDYLLDLGQVMESAEIKLNGKKAGTSIGPVYQILIPGGSFKKKNILEIIVTNSMANRIIDLDKKNIPWKKFYNVNFPSKFATNRGTDGIFTASKWQPRPSGLMGPVTLTPLTLGQ